jgi:DNA-binding NtrC family response regulator
VHILRVLALSDFNKAHAARALGITRATLYTKLREYGVAHDAATG